MNDFYRDILKCLNKSNFVEYANSEMGEIVASGRIKYTEKVSKEFVKKVLWNDESTWYVIEWFDSHSKFDIKFN